MKEKDSCAPQLHICAAWFGSMWIFSQSPGHPELSAVRSYYASVVKRSRAGLGRARPGWAGLGRAGPGLRPLPAVVRPCLCLLAAFFFDWKRHCCIIQSREETVAPEDWQADGEAASQEAGGQILAYLDFSSRSLKNPL